jgi:hypothetical protein
MEKKIVSLFSKYEDLGISVLTPFGFKKILAAGLT